MGTILVAQGIFGELYFSPKPDGKTWGENNEKGWRGKEV